MLLRPFRKKAGLVAVISRTLRIMKLTAFLLLIICLHASAKTFSQEITLSLKNVNLETVFKEVQKQTTYRFVYTNEQLENAIKVTIQVKNETLGTVLGLCFKNQPLTYTIEEKNIIIQIKENQDRDTPAISQFNITGKVTNEKGEPLAGATLKIKETSIGTIANDNGEFSIENVEPNSTLVISSIGYQTQEIKLKGRTYIIVQLKMAVNNLDETVVIAYGKTTRRLNTGSISKVSEADISKQPVSNPLNAVQGRAAGVFINTQNGLPGGNITVQIRGKGSINAGTDPLYVIDGVPFNSTPLNSSFSTLSDGIAGATSPLNSINPSDIESIEILKDADATAIYGSRAANGVILITTKKGMPGKTKLDLNFYTGFSRLADFPHLLNIQQYLELRHEGFQNDGITPTTSNAPDLLKWDTTRSVNWPKYMLGGTAVTTNGQIGVSGGNENTTFLISGNYRMEGTILRGDQKYQRVGGHVLIHHSSTDKKFFLDFSSSYTDDNNKQLSSSIFGTLTLPPNIPIYDNTGNYNWVGITSANPEAVLKRKSTSRTDNFLTNLSMRYSIVHNLQLKTNLGYTRTEMDQVMTYPKISFNPNSGSQSYAYYGNNKISSLIIEPQLEYSKNIKKSNAQLLAGMSWQQTTQEGNFITGTDYSNDDLLEFAGAAGTISATNLYSQYKYASLFGRLHYDYNRKYILNASVRRDGSSRFGPGSQFGNFGAIGVGWIFSEERSLKKLPFISYGKLRASYGITGNDLISDYQYLSTYGTTGATYQDVTGLAPTRIANADFRWESNKKLEIAIEAGLAKNRILFTAAWYRNRSGNQLIDYPLPYMSGPFGHYVANLPALVENKGFEFEANAVIIRKDAFSWSLAGNITIPKNKLLKYPGLEASAFANTYVIGEDLSIRKALNFTGINTQTGLPEYEDINHDGVISTPEDYAIVGRTSPYFFGGFGSDVQFHGFQLNVFFQFSKQYAQGLATIPGTRSNKFNIALQRWRNTGDVSTIAKATVAPAGEYFNLALSDAAFYNASYARLKNVSLSYTLPSWLANKLKFSNCRIYCEGQNLVTWRKEANLYDPETANSGIAPLKTVVIGIQLTL